jgi:hypothetical protein
MNEKLLNTGYLFAGIAWLLFIVLVSLTSCSQDNITTNKNAALVEYESIGLVFNATDARSETLYYDIKINDMLMLENIKMENATTINTTIGIPSNQSSTVSLFVRDLSGNQAMRTFNVTPDLTPPNITIIRVYEVTIPISVGFPPDPEPIPEPPSYGEW